MEERCEQINNTERTLNLIGSKWVIVVLVSMCTGRKGFNEIMRSIPGISPRLLSARLKELVDNGLANKKVLPTNPPQVEYTLTKRGESLRHIVMQLGDWGASLPTK